MELIAIINQQTVAQIAVYEGKPSLVFKSVFHCVKSVQIRSFFWSEYRKYEPEKTPYLDTFHAMFVQPNMVVPLKHFTYILELIDKLFEKLQTM